MRNVYVHAREQTNDGRFARTCHTKYGNELDGKSAVDQYTSKTRLTLEDVPIRNLPDHLGHRKSLCQTIGHHMSGRAPDFVGSPHQRAGWPYDIFPDTQDALCPAGKLAYKLAGVART